MNINREAIFGDTVEKDGLSQGDGSRSDKAGGQSPRDFLMAGDGRGVTDDYVFDLSSWKSVILSCGWGRLQKGQRSVWACL